MANLAEFIRSLVAPKDKPDDVGELEAAIARLEAERAAAEAELTAIAERRPTLLLSDGDEKLDIDERASERAYRAVEKVDLVLPGLRDRLSTARRALRRDWEKDLTARCDATLAKYLTAFGAAVEVGEALAALRMEGQSNGFMAEMASILPPEPRVLSRDSLGFLAKEVDRRRDAARPRPAPQPRVVALVPKPAATVAPKSAKPVRPAPAPPPAPAPQQLDPPAPDEAGEIKVVITKPGYELEGRGRLPRGETLSLPAADALKVVQACCGEFEARL